LTPKNKFYIILWVKNATQISFVVTNDGVLERLQVGLNRFDTRWSDGKKINGT